jgi:L-fuconolactonase
VSVVVDSHVHLWDERHTPQPWMTDAHAAIARPFGPEDLRPLLEDHAVNRAIVVQGACLDSDTDYLLAQAERTDWIGAVTAWLCLDEPERARARLDELAVRPKFRGVRHLIHHEREHWIVQPSVLETIAELQAREIILELPVEFPRHFDDVDDLARRFPQLRIVIDHLGKPPIGTGEMARWEAQLQVVAAHPNVMAKISGLNTALSDPDWSTADLRPCIEVAVDCFGPDRLMCGSDWPVMLLNGDYGRVWEATGEAIAAVVPADFSRLMGANAVRAYCLDAPRPA